MVCNLKILKILDLKQGKGGGVISSQGHVSYSALVLLSSSKRDVTVPKYVQTPNSISNTRY